MALNIYVNHSSSDEPLNTSGIDWVLLDSDNDRFIISDGNDTIADGESSPGESALNSASPIVGLEHTYEKYFLDDVSEVELKEIFLMGEGNYRYVLAFDFDDFTISEPVLEAWDDITMQTFNSVVLGAGTPSLSWLKGVVTTDGLPGASWIGDALAGSSDGHFLQLNNGNGALIVAKTLYANLKIIMPASQEDAGATTPILVVKWTDI